MQPIKSNDAAATPSTFHFTPSLFRARRIASLLCQRQIDGENRTAPEPFTFRADRSAMQLHQVPHDREPEPESALSSRDRTLSLTNTVEHVWQKCGRDAFTRITDRQTRCRLNTSEIDVNATAALCELDGIGQQV